MCRITLPNTNIMVVIASLTTSNTGELINVAAVTRTTASTYTGQKVTAPSTNEVTMRISSETVNMRMRIDMRMRVNMRMRVDMRMRMTML